MEREDFAQFCEVWTATATSYDKKVTAMSLRLAYEVLRGYTLDDVKRAITAHMRNPDVGQFQPKPADVIRQIEGTTGDAALAAWTKVERAIRSTGTYASVAFDDPLIHATIEDMGGWIKLGSVKEEELPFRAREFSQRYRAYTQRPPEAPPRYLPGISEQHNAAGGHEPPKIRLLGDVDKARAMLASGGGSGPLLAGVADEARAIGGGSSNAPRALPGAADANA